MPLRPTRDWGQQGYLPHAGRRATRDGTRDQPASINALTGQSHTHGRRHLGVGARHHRIFPRAAERTKHGLTPTRPRSNHAAMRDWQEDLVNVPHSVVYRKNAPLQPSIHIATIHSFHFHPPTRSRSPRSSAPDDGQAPPPTRPAHNSRLRARESTGRGCHSGGHSPSCDPGFLDTELVPNAVRSPRK